MTSESERQLLEKWKRAVVHVEGAADSESYVQRSEALRTRLDAGEIAWQEYLDLSSALTARTERSAGTALFYEDNAGRALLTARHVVEDVGAAKRRPAPSAAELAAAEFLEPRDPDVGDIFNLILRVPRIDEDPQALLLPLQNMRAGPTRLRPYSFSPPYLDLAVLSLERPDFKLFADELIEKGYEPVGPDDITDRPSHEGADIFTVGYPAMVRTKVLGQTKADRNLASSYQSLPAFAFGRVSMLHPGVDYFWADISVYPGNSGGPIVEGGKLVGIVSGQAITEFEPQFGQARIPFGKITKGVHLRRLIDEQRLRDMMDRER